MILMFLVFEILEIYAVGQQVR